MSGDLDRLRERFRTETLTAVERHLRETELLGPEHGEPLPGFVAIRDQQSFDPVAESRRVREVLHQADIARAEQQRVRDRLEAIDPLDIDTEYLRMMREMFADGHVAEPDSDARPMLDPAVLETLRRAGIDLDGESAG